MKSANSGQVLQTSHARLSILSMQSLRAALLKIHRWLGFAAAAFLALLSGTGLILAFEEPLDRALNRSLTHISTQGPALSIDQISDTLTRDYPGYSVQRWTFARDSEETYSVVLRSGSDTQTIFLDPHTGRTIGNIAQANPLVGTIHRLHTQILAGPTGKTIVAYSAISLFILNVSGLILWWRRKISRVQRNKSIAVLRYQLHQFAGITAWLGLTIFSITGIVLHWDREILAALQSGTKVSAQSTQSSPGERRHRPESDRRLNADQFIAIALKRFPGARVTTLDFGGTDSNSTRVIMKYPEDHTPAGRTNLYLDNMTGDTLESMNSRNGPIEYRFVKVLSRELHTGSILGWPSQFFAQVFCIGLLTLAVTGPWMAFARWRNRAPPPRLSAPTFARPN